MPTNHYNKMFEHAYPVDHYTTHKALSSVVGFQRYYTFKKCAIFRDMIIMDLVRDMHIKGELLGGFLRCAEMITILNVAVNIPRGELCEVLGISGKHFARVIRQYEEAGLFRITYPNGRRSKEVGKDIAYNIVFNPYYVFRGTKLAREGYLDYLNENDLQW